MTTRRRRTIGPIALTTVVVVAAVVWIGVSASSSPEDPDPPTPPTGLTADVDGPTVRLSWTPGVDAVQLTGVLVHRDGRYLRWVAEATGFTDRDVPPGEHRYEVRAQDYPSLNHSEPARITVVID